MSGNFTADREQQALQDIIDGGVDVALHDSDPSNDPDGSTEITAGDYSRATVPESDWSFSGDGPTEMTNDAPIDFGEAESNWGDVEWASLVNGNDFEVTIDLGESGGSVPDGVEVSFNSGEIEVTID